MRQFMDFHEAVEDPAGGTRADHHQHTAARHADEFEVRQIELYRNADANAYCLLECPDEDAIRRHHHALGVPCGDVPSSGQHPPRIQLDRPTNSRPPTTQNAHMRPAGVLIETVVVRPNGGYTRGLPRDLTTFRHRGKPAEQTLPAPIVTAWQR
jgi:Protein of unknown function (DUF4242)